MFPPSPFNHPVPSFEYPVHPPDTQPDDVPTTQICINNDWLPFCAGALKQLLLESTWIVADEAALLDVQGRVFNLISQFLQNDDGCGALTPFKLCLSGTFLDEPYGYTADSGMVCTNVWTIGTGWETCLDGSNVPILNITRQFGHSTIINSFEFHTIQTVGGGSYDITVSWSDHGTVQRVDTLSVLTGGDTISNSSPVNADMVQINITGAGPDPTHPIDLGDWKLCYEGAFPLSQPGAAWTIDLPFALNDGGFAAVVGGSGHVYASYSGGQWNDNTIPPSAAYAQLQIHREFTLGADTLVNSVDVYVTCGSDNTVQDATSTVVVLPSGTNVLATFNPINPLSDPSYGAGSLRIILTNDPQTSYTPIYLTRVVIKGTGSKPT